MIHNLTHKLIKPAFHAVTPADIPLLARYMPKAGSRTCDYTVGGVTMWSDYFRYEIAVVDDTLFMRGVCEDDLGCRAYSLPIGGDTRQAVAALDEYCRSRGERLVLSAVPEDRLAELSGPGWSIDELVDWSDYIYGIDDLADLPGGRYGKKRNHVNRFMLDNPDYRFEPMSVADAAEVMTFYHSLDGSSDDATPTAAIEREQVFNVLKDLSLYPFEGATLRLGDGKIAAFTIGERVGDTLFVHIEKMRHDVNGAGETVNKMFVSMMRDRYSELRWVNREEDVGDPGLRRAKESYHPAMKLRKYNVRFGE